MAIRETLELDLTQARQQIEEVASLLEAASARFTQSLTEGLNAFAAGIPQIQVPLELLATTDLAQVITQDVESADGTDLGIDTTFENVDAGEIVDPVVTAFESTNVELPTDVLIQPDDITEGFITGIENADGTSVSADVQLQGDATGAQEALDQLAATGVEVGVTVDLGDAQSEIDALGDQELNITVNADTSQASAAIDETGNKAKESKGDIDNLDAAIGGLAVGGKIAAAAIATTVAAAGGLFVSAVNAQGAVDAFNSSLGELAPAILNIDANGLSIDLQQLAQDLGSDDEAVLGVAQRFAQLGLTSDATSESIARANSQLFAVAGNLRSINPSLGELDQIATRAGQAFIRGGRAAAGLGLNLTSTEIRARAAIQTGKSLNDEFSQFELFAAGASLASEQFGDSVATNIDKALENPIIALGNIKQILGDTLEELGKPLIAPILTLLRDLIPVAVKVSEIFGALAQAALPGILVAVNSLVPIIEIFGDAFIEAFADLEPAFTSLGEAFVEIVKAAQPLIDVSVVIIDIFGQALAGAIQLIADVINGLPDEFLTLAVALGTARVAVTQILPFLVANPWLTLAAGIGLAVGALYSLVRGAEPAAPILDEVAESVFENATSVEGLADAISLYLVEAGKFIETQKILANPDLVDALDEAGITVQEFTRWVQEGTDGQDAFVAALLRANPELQTLITNSLGVSGAFSSWTASSQNAFESVARGRFGLETLIENFDSLSGGVQASNRALFDQKRVQNDVNKLAAENAVRVAEQAGEQENYTFLLKQFEIELQKVNDAEERRKAASGEAKQELDSFIDAYKAFSLEVVTGVTNFDNLAGAAARYGADLAGLEEIYNDISKELDDFTAKVVGQVPTLADAFSTLGEEGVTSNVLLEDFEKSLQATRDWSDTLVRLANENKTALLGVAAELGPERTRLLIDTYGQDEEALNAHLQRVAFIEATARAEAEIAAKIGFLQSRDLYAGEYDALAELLRDKAFFGPLTKEDLDNALAELENAKPGQEAAAANLADGIANSYATNLANGIYGAVDQTGQAAQDLVTGATNSAAGIAGPAGADIGSGIATGAATGVAGASGEISTAVTDAVAEAGGAAVAEAEASGQELGSLLASGAIGALLQRQASLVSFMTAVLTGIGNANVTKSAAEKSGKDLAGVLVMGMLAEFTYARDENIIGEALESVINSAGSATIPVALANGLDLGGALVQGMEVALRAGSSSVSRLAANIIASAEEAARLEAESESPSKAWERIGRDLVAGLSKGLDATSGNAVRSAAGVIGAANTAAPASSETNITVTVPVTVSGDATPELGRAVGRAAAAELRNVLRLEGRIA